MTTTTNRKKVHIKTKNRKGLIKKYLSKIDFDIIRINGLEPRKTPSIYIRDHKIRATKPHYRFNLPRDINKTDEIVAWETANSSFYENGDMN